MPQEFLIPLDLPPQCSPAYYVAFCQYERAEKKVERWSREAAIGEEQALTRAADFEEMTVATWRLLEAHCNERARETTAFYRDAVDKLSIFVNEKHCAQDEAQQQAGQN